jgi:holliday junction DNA helicase RuvA
MLYRIHARLEKKEEHRVILETNGIFYEIFISRSVFSRLEIDEAGCVDLILYHYLNMDKNKATPVLVGFIDELERDFFEKFISVSGVGPKAALKALDKPISLIAKAIEESDVQFLISLAGIGKQRAKQIIAHLQGKVGRFTLIKGEPGEGKPLKKEIVQEALEILKRLQYSSRESENMVKNVLAAKPSVSSAEELLNEIYRQRV